jgi:hypothetical protein
MISLLTKSSGGGNGSSGANGGILGALGNTLRSARLSDVFGLLGNLVTGMGKYQSSQFGIDAMEQVDAINEAYKEQLMSRQVRDMVGGATEAYGKWLLGSVRAGGTMPSYTSGMWQGVSDGMEDYGADLRAMALNSKLRQASFAAQHGANRMAMMSSIVDNMLNTYNDISSRVPKGSAAIPGVPAGYRGSKFLLPEKKRKGGQ